MSDIVPLWENRKIARKATCFSQSETANPASVCHSHSFTSSPGLLSLPSFPLLYLPLSFIPTLSHVRLPPFVTNDFNRLRILSSTSSSHTFFFLFICLSFRHKETQSGLLLFWIHTFLFALNYNMQMYWSCYWKKDGARKKNSQKRWEIPSFLSTLSPLSFHPSFCHNDLSADSWGVMESLLLYDCEDN